MSTRRAPTPTVLFITEREADTVEREEETAEPAIGTDELITNFNDFEARLSFDADITLCIPKTAEIRVLRKPMSVR